MADLKEDKPEAEKLNSGLGPIVAHHYNSIEEKGQVARVQSRIFHLRAFNNWIKSMLINDAAQIFRNQNKYNLTVLDMCCGKGGDILKWNKLNIVRHVVFTDIASNSVMQCEERFNNVRGGRKFSAEFITADCTKERLKSCYKNENISFDIVSIQFSFHYCFESLPQAQMMLRNVAENLKPGGYFIGTIPNSNRIVKKLLESKEKEFGNEVYKVEFESVEQPFPLFGSKYFFQLEDVVNCPEFLVHFPCLEKLALEFGLRLLFKYTFDDYFSRKLSNGHFLLERMQALETFPQLSGDKLASDKPDEYSHAEAFQKEKPNFERFGTLSKSEWEAVSLYLVFAFEKI